MEEALYPTPTTSYSTPLNQPNAAINVTRPRRHTITRPDSAIAMLSDIEDGDDDNVEQEKALDRISGILDGLIQEANEAVQGLEKERAHLIKKPTVSKRSPSILLSKCNSDPRRTRKLRNSHTPAVTTSSTPHTKLLFRQVPRSHSTLLPVKSRSSTPKRRKCVQSSIEASFERLDSSIALVDSISRDLASSSYNGRQDDLTALILILLLHIPLITMIIDLCTTTSTSNTFHISSMVFWGCLFLLTHLIVDSAASEISARQLSSLPGSFTVKQTQFQTNALKRRNSV
ncbi:hypothetical protein BY458DRAFT_491332 [Sporodiniella umbellata]|nr:hypothetical protein BY458DRAFT_491332 [Sporodiniella umbellata]